MKADLAIYINMLGVPGQYKSVALMLGYKLDSSCCANRDGFRRDSHICTYILHIGNLAYQFTVLLGLLFILVLPTPSVPVGSHSLLSHAITSTETVWPLLVSCDIQWYTAYNLKYIYSRA